MRRVREEVDGDGLGGQERGAGEDVGLGAAQVDEALHGGVGVARHIHQSLDGRRLPEHLGAPAVCSINKKKKERKKKKGLNTQVI